MNSAKMHSPVRAADPFRRPEQVFPPARKEGLCRSGLFKTLLLKTQPLKTLLLLSLISMVLLLLAGQEPVGAQPAQPLPLQSPQGEDGSGSQDGEAGDMEGPGDDGGVEWRTVVKWIGLTAHAEKGESGYVREGDDTRQSTELSLRIQVQDNSGEHWGYRVDYLNVARNLSGTEGTELRLGAEIFRYKPWRRDLESPDTEEGQSPSTQTFHWSHEIDHALVRVGGAAWEAVLGRHPVTWGVGRFWSPTDLFAAFAPLALDTEYKPGVDGITLSWFPSDFSELNLIGVASPDDALSPQGDVDNSGALRWRTQVGEESEATLVAASVREESLLGGSIETSWLDAGWRLEGVLFRPPATEQGEEDTYGYWVTGVDLQLTGSGWLAGTVLAAEVYRNTLGARKESEMPAVLATRRFGEGRLPHLAATVAALAAEQELAGLWRLGYAFLAAPLLNDVGNRQVSTLHRLTLAYSISDEAEALLAWSTGNGAGLEENPFAPPTVRSEFGHLPDTFYLSVKFVL